MEEAKVQQQAGTSVTGGPGGARTVRVNRREYPDADLDVMAPP